MKNMKCIPLFISLVVFSCILSFGMVRCSSKVNDSDAVNDCNITKEELSNAFDYKIYYEDEHFKISSKSFYSQETSIPGVSEVWHVNKDLSDSSLCAKSNPRYFGSGCGDSIPSITSVHYCPGENHLIVEGPTCDAGIIATFIVDMNTGKFIQLPTNNGFVGFTNWNEYIIASSKENDIDYDLVLWYENIYILDWNGQIVDSSSTKNAEIEKTLPLIHHEANWDVKKIKLDKHIRLYPPVDDSSFYGNEFQVVYPELSRSDIMRLDTLCELRQGWRKNGNKYMYDYDDYNNSDGDSYGIFVSITVDPMKKTGIVRKGAYSHPENSPLNEQ